MCDGIIQDLNKVVKLKQDGDIRKLKEPNSLFKFGTNIKLDIVSQKYDPDWDALVDLCDDDILKHKDMLKMVVQPLLNDNSSVSEVS